jgi:multidrug efflux pump subunit AcrA (membrane-fusion protein)
MPSNQPKWVLGAAAGFVVLAILLAFLREYNQQLDTAKSDGITVAKAQCVADTNSALLLTTQQSLATVQKQLKDADDAVATLRQQKAATDKQLKQLQGEIKYVTSTWIPPGKAVPEPLPHCVYTNGFVRVYNQAITLSSPNLPAIAYPSGVAGTAETTPAIDPSLQPSNVRQSDILQHVTQYGARCNDIESQLNQLLDYLEKQQPTQGTNG